MIKAGKILFTICAAAAVLTFNGCVFSSDDAAQNAGQTSETIEAKPIEPKAIEELIAQSVIKDEKPLKLRDLTKSAILSDGSQYVQMKDAEGNKIESRFFPDGSLVRSVIVKTSVDGAIKTFVRSWNGKVEMIETGGVAMPWASSARELALIAGFKQEPPPAQSYQPVVKPPVTAETVQKSASNPVVPPETAVVEVPPPVNTTEKK